MPNKQYVKGARYERKVVNEAKELGNIAFRSAGSHSPIDVITIDPTLRLIRLIQCKAGKSYSQKFKDNLEKKYEFLNGENWEVCFEVLDGETKT